MNFKIILAFFLFRSIFITQRKPVKTIVLAKKGKNDMSTSKKNYLAKYIFLKFLSLDIKSIVLCGIEAHACVQQTVFDLMEKNYDVHVVVDACSSRSMVDRLVFGVSNVYMLRYLEIIA